MRVLTFASLAAAIAAQSVPLPDTSDSFLRLGGDASAQVQIDAHVDLLCPDCAAAWPVLQQIAANYAKAQVSVNLHVFPLPYHTFAFSAAQGGNVIASLNSSTTAVFNWANALFEGAQNNFWNDVVANLSSTQVLQQLAQLANQATGVPIAGFLAGMQDPNINMNTRISWKYGCSRGVTGTPSFFVNQLPVEADATWTLAQWTQLLDPLLNNTASAKLAVARQGVQLSGFSAVHIAAVGPVGRS